MRGGLVLGLEDTGSRMSRLGKAELVYGELMAVDEVLARIDAVTVDDVQLLAHELLRQPMALAAIGPYDDDRQLRAAVA
jgi:predicted Zn-dependent peptidase